LRTTTPVGMSDRGDKCRTVAAASGGGRTAATVAAPLIWSGRLPARCLPGMPRRLGPRPPRGRLRPGRRRRRLTRRLRHLGAPAGPTYPPGQGLLPGRKARLTPVDRRGRPGTRGMSSSSTPFASTHYWSLAGSTPRAAPYGTHWRPLIRNGAQSSPKPCGSEMATRRNQPTPTFATACARPESSSRWWSAPTTADERRASMVTEFCPAGWRWLEWSRSHAIPGLRLDCRSCSRRSSRRQAAAGWPAGPGRPQWCRW
jgi:hypothetical protein